MHEAVITAAAAAAAAGRRIEEEEEYKKRPAKKNHENSKKKPQPERIARLLLVCLLLVACLLVACCLLLCSVQVSSYCTTNSKNWCEIYIYIYSTTCMLCSISSSDYYRMVRTEKRGGPDLEGKKKERFEEEIWTGKMS